MSLPLLFSTAFIVGFSGAMMPGPVTAITFDHALRRGISAAPLIAIGHGLLEIVVVFLLVLGLGSAMARAEVAAAIGIAGGLVLGRMGWGMVGSARRGEISLQQDGETSRQAGAGPVAAGMLSTLSNPYWFLWWATVGAGYVTLSQQHGTPGVLAFFFGHILADLSWFLVLAALMVTGKRLISDTVYRRVVMVLGSFLIVFAAYFVWVGFGWVLELGS